MRATASFLLIVLLAAACGPEFGLERLSIVRVSWDTLRVEAHFEARHMLRTTRPDTVFTLLLGADGDTLYAGDGRLIVVDDRTRPSGERLMLEACAIFGDEWICSQEAVRASPKRFVAESEIAYPDSADFTRGRYSLQIAYERLRPDGTGWERIPGPRHPYAELRLRPEGDADAALTAVVHPGEGEFDLESARHWEDFRFALATSLAGEESTAVHVDVHAGLAPGETSKTASFVHWVRGPSHEDRWREVTRRSERAARAVVAALAPHGVFEAYLPDTTRWSFDFVADTYRIDLKVTWRVRRGRTHSVRGLLVSDGDSERARFVLRGGRRATRRLWERMIGAPELSIPG